MAPPLRSTFTLTRDGVARLKRRLNQLKAPVRACCRPALTSEGLSHEVWSYTVSKTLRIGEFCGSPSWFIATTACSKLPMSFTAMPCRKRCHSLAYSSLYMVASVLRICSGLPSSVRSSLPATLSTQSLLDVSLFAASRIASSTYCCQASRVNAPEMATLPASVPSLSALLAVAPRMRATVIGAKRVEARALISAYTRSRAGMPRTTRRRLSRVCSTSARLVSASAGQLSSPTRRR